MSKIDSGALNSAYADSMITSGYRSGNLYMEWLSYHIEKYVKHCVNCCAIHLFGYTLAQWVIRSQQVKIHTLINPDGKPFPDSLYIRFEFTDDGIKYTASIEKRPKMYE